MPLSLDIDAANKAEVNLIEPLLERRDLARTPKRLMYVIQLLNKY